MHFLLKNLMLMGQQFEFMSNLESEIFSENYDCDYLFVTYEKQEGGIVDGGEQDQDEKNNKF